MFDTNRVARNIKNARTKLNMTQMNLADEMGVSYQAVSNWERGNSMPDISKLPDLCKILKISFEELIGEQTEETDIAKKLMQDNVEDVSLEEVAHLGQLLKPVQLERKVNEEMGKDSKISFSTLVSLAPFIGKEALDKMIEKCIQNNHVDVNKITAVAPFLSKQSIEKVAEYLINRGQEKKLISLAPFMKKGRLTNQINNIQFDMQKECEENFGSNISDIDEMDEEMIANIAFKALEQGRDVSDYLDYLDENVVAQLADRAMELGIETDIFLDYMDEDDVEKLAMKALESGKAIESYLDYMDEDAIRKLLLYSVNKK